MRCFKAAEVWFCGLSEEASLSLLQKCKKDIKMLQADNIRMSLCLKRLFYLMCREWRDGEERGEQSTLNAITIGQVGDNSGIDGL